MEKDSLYFKISKFKKLNTFGSNLFEKALLSRISTPVFKLAETNK